MQVRECHIESAVIGMWRMGASPIEICYHLKLEETDVLRIVATYKIIILKQK